jgi:transcriptional regulator with XRE-family HTH domain
MEPSACDLVVEARTRAGLSRNALATLAGVPASTVCRIEARDFEPTFAMVQHLISAAGAELHVELRHDVGPPTLASLSTAVRHTGRRHQIDWTRLRGFADWVARHPDQLADALASPPVSTHTPLDPILAAFAEELADTHNVARPAWARTVAALDRPWFGSATPTQRARAEANTPEPFLRRNVILARSTLFRTSA